MCLIVVAYRVHPRYSTIVAQNRDEYYNRETKPLHLWEDDDATIVGGKDMKGGGTWLGVDRNCPERWAAVTNYRGWKETKERPNRKSRGTILFDYLSTTTTTTAADYCCQLQKTTKYNNNNNDSTSHDDNDTFNGFHVLVGDKTGIYYYGNRDDRTVRCHDFRPLPPGIYGLSNDGLDTPWPKVVRSKSLLSSIITHPNNNTEEQLHKDICQNLLCDRKRPQNDEELPNTGITLEFERYLSSIFIDGEPTYGTRSSTSILIQPPENDIGGNNGGHFSIMETTWPSQQSTLLQYDFSKGTWSTPHSSAPL